MWRQETTIDIVRVGGTHSNLRPDAKGCLQKLTEDEPGTFPQRRLPN
jgi:hypothetical protein